ncbi:MAG: glycosyltransferase family 4 protein [Melioribacteraceae bacterium]|nr:glycosyltransferase family 4 protein [Melioribacteraceae bacterium]
MESKNILLISPFFRPNIGGVESALDTFCDVLSKKRKIFVVTYSPLTTKVKKYSIYEKNKNLHIYRIPWIGLNLFPKVEKIPILAFLYLTPILFISSFVFLLFRSRDIDLIDCRGINGAFIGFLLKKIFKKKTVVTLHSIYGFESNKFAKIVATILKSFNLVLTTTTPSLNEVKKLGIKKCQKYSYWVDEEVFIPISKDEAKKKLNIPDIFTVLFVGRLLEKKGILDLIEAVEGMKTSICLLIIGTGDLKEDIIFKAEQNNQIKFIGTILNTKLPPYYSAADLTVVPSKYEELFGRVIIESLACGTPVIGTNVGGISEVLSSDVGLLINPGSQNISQAISKLQDNNILLKDMTKKSRNYILENYSKKNILYIGDLYDNII